jgi:hypothetical protein
VPLDYAPFLPHAKKRFAAGRRVGDRVAPGR